MDNVARQRDVCTAASVLLSDVVGREVEIGLAYGDRTNGAGFQIPGIVLVKNSLCTPDIVRGNLSGPVDFWMVVDGQKNHAGETQRYQEDEDKHLLQKKSH